MDETFRPMPLLLARLVPMAFSPTSLTIQVRVAREADEGGILVAYTYARKGRNSMIQLMSFPERWQERRYRLTAPTIHILVPRRTHPGDVKRLPFPLLSPGSR